MNTMIFMGWLIWGAAMVHQGALIVLSIRSLIRQEAVAQPYPGAVFEHQDDLFRQTSTMAALLILGLLGYLISHR